MSLQRFIFDEVGAVTVDWVVLTAAIVGMGIASVGAVRTGTSAVGSGIGTSLASVSLPLLELNPYRFRKMTQDGTSWNSIPGRIAQMAAHSDAELQYSFDHYGLHYFNDAISRNYNASCDGCRGAGNRLDLMKIQVDELAKRGLATQTHHDALADADRRYVQTFGY